MCDCSSSSSYSDSDSDSSCHGDCYSCHTPNAPAVRFFNNIVSDTYAFDVYVDDVLQASGLVYGASTAYLPISKGKHVIKFIPNVIGVTLMINLYAKKRGRYSIFALGSLIDPVKYPLMLKIFNDKPKRCHPAEPPVRFINGAAGAYPVNVFFTNPMKTKLIFKEVPYPHSGCGTWRCVRMGTYEMDVIIGTTTTSYLPGTISILLEMGFSYTFVLSGIPNDPSNPITVIQFKDPLQ